jgi:hypothetical protein
MSLLHRDELDELLAQREGPCVALYMPTHRAGREIQQGPIRLKNLLKKAEHELDALGVNGTVASGLLAPATDLLDERPFWEHQSHGLALFLAPGFSRGYRLPVEFAERAVVAERFHVKPLLQFLVGDGHFYVLALSENEVRILEGTRFRVGHLDLAGLPTDMANALRFEHYEKSLQFRSGQGGGLPGARRAAAYHGQGAIESVTKDQRLRYFRQVDKVVTRVLGVENAPLVLAGVEEHFPIYREASAYPRLVPGGVPGNPDKMPDEELHRRAWALVEPIFHKAEVEALTRYRQMAGTGRTSSQIEEVAPAAHRGKVDTLFVASGRQCWGRFDANHAGGAATVRARPEPGDMDLLDFAAGRTLKHGGTVFVLPPESIPSEGSPLAAILRR